MYTLRQLVQGIADQSGCVPIEIEPAVTRNGVTQFPMLTVSRRHIICSSIRGRQETKTAMVCLYTCCYWAGEAKELPRFGGQHWSLAWEVHIITIFRRQTVSLYVDRSSQQWIVRDSDGRFWIIPVVDHAWDHRQPIQLTAEIKLEPVPGHYKYILGLPF